MKTGKLVPESTVYSNECCVIKLDFTEDHIFPRCRRCGRACSWQETEESFNSELRAA